MSGPEFELVLACCRSAFAGARPDEVRPGAGELSWAKFVRLCRRHRVQGIVAKALRKNGISAPAEAAEAIGRDALSIAALNLRFAAAGVRLLDAFNQGSIPLLFVKGLTLSALAYGDPFVKMSSDVDILVEARDLGAAAALLTTLGYRPSAPAVESSSPALARWHARLKESIWLSSDGEVVIELHTRLADNPALVPNIGVTSPRQLVEIGSQGALPTLTTEDLFAYLCVHGASSAWFRLKWIADLAALVHQAGEEQIEGLYRSALARGAGRAPAQALLLADRLSLLSLPADLRSEMERDPVNRLLAGIAFRALTHEAEPTQRSLGTVPIHLSQPLLLGGLRFKLGELVRQAREVSHRTWGVA